jgi:pimeloyl-ACP methyl ester carboxylesterase
MLVLLVHGLGRTPLSLFGLASTLRRAGHRTRFFGYSSTLESVPRIIRRLTSVLRELAQSATPVGLVGHSLGGLFLRRALGEVPALRVHRLVLLGTPASPPRMAALAWKWFPPFRLFTRDCGRFLTSPEAFARLPQLPVPVTLIAGTAGPRGRFSPFGTEPNDGLVAVSEVTMPGTEPLLFPVLHTFMMDARRVRLQVEAAFRDPV